MDLYAILGVPRNADEDTIRAAYRVLARRYHPDRGQGSSVETFRQITEAYRTLMDLGNFPACDPAQPVREHVVPVRTRQEDPAVFGRYYRGRPPFPISFVHKEGGSREPPE